MFFANLWYLWFIPVIAVPILLNIWKKKRIREIEFPYFFLIQSSNTANLSSLHILNIILLLLRMLLIAGLILFMARPLMTGAQPAVSGADTVPTVYIMDNSVSMSYTHEGTTLFARAQSQLRDALQALDPNIPAGLVYINRQGNPELVESRNNPERLLKALGDVTLSYYRFDLRASLNMANTYMRSLTGRFAKSAKNIVLFTDNQIHNLSPGDNIRLLPSVSLTMVVPEQLKAGGLGWTGYDFSNRLVKEGGRGSVDCKLSNFGQSVRDDVIVRFYVDDVLLDESAITLTPGEVEARQFQYRAGETAALRKATLTVLAADFDIDNTLYLVVPVYNTARIIVVGTTEETAYLNAALHTYFPHDAARYISIVTTLDAAGPISDTDIVIFASEQMTSDQIRWLKGFVSRGGGAIVFHAPADQGSDENGVSTVQQAQLAHPVLQPYAEAGEKVFETIRFNASGGQTVYPEMQKRTVLLESGDGKPFLEQLSVQEGTLFVYYTDAAQRFSNLVRTDMYIPLLHRTIDYILAARTGFPVYFNRTMEQKVTLSNEVPFSVQWITPEGDRYEQQSLFLGGMYRISALPVSVPGYYTLVQQDSKPVVFAYNIAAGEGNLTQADRKTLATMLPDSRTTYIDMFAGPEKQSFVRRKHIAGYVLIFCITVALVELGVANRCS